MEMPRPRRSASMIRHATLLPRQTDHALHALPGDVAAVRPAGGGGRDRAVDRLAAAAAAEAAGAAAGPRSEVEVAALPERGPPEGPPVLEFYNLPVRLAAVVLAPVGPGRELPPGQAACPAAGRHPAGPGQGGGVAPAGDPPLAEPVSARGFAHLFFSNARLPGQAGKGTPWSSVAGVVKVRPAGDGRPGPPRRRRQQPRPDDHRRGVQVVGVLEGEVELVGEWRVGSGVVGGSWRVGSVPSRLRFRSFGRIPHVRTIHRPRPEGHATGQQEAQRFNHEYIGTEQSCWG